MTRGEAKELLPVIQAFAEGKKIEYHDDNDDEWIETSTPVWQVGVKYRIKSEPKYRPFKNGEECCNEMIKHQPFGWIKAPNGDFLYIDKIFNDSISYKHSITRKYSSYKFDEHLEDNYTFFDGTPVGIKEE